MRPEMTADDALEFRARVRRAIAGLPDPEEDRYLEDLARRAEAQRAAWGYPSTVVPSRRRHVPVRRRRRTGDE